MTLVPVLLHEDERQIKEDSQKLMGQSAWHTQQWTKDPVTTQHDKVEHAYTGTHKFVCVIKMFLNIMAPTLP